MAGSDEFTKEFLTESREGLDRLDNDLVALETDPHDIGRLDSAFRALHTIKGSAGFLDFPLVGEIAHAGEAILQRLRSGQLSISSSISDLLFQVLDAIRSLLATIESTGKEGDDTFAPLKEDLRCIGIGEVPAAATSSRKPDTQVLDLASISQEHKTRDETIIEPFPEDQVEAGNRISAASRDVTERSLASDVPTDATVDVPSTGSDVTAKHEPLPSVSAETCNPAVTDEPRTPPLVAPTTDAHPESRSPVLPATVTLAPAPAAAPRSVPEPVAFSDSPGRESTDSSFVLPRGSSGDSGGKSGAASLVRVDVQLLDRLMNLVGELVLARNQIVEISSYRADSMLVSPVQRLNVLTSELQEGVLKTRMQQIGVIWQRYPRMVRDFARQTGKEVSLELIGAETELDKSLVEAIADPLIHLIRNAIDHGIEKPQLRKIKGKPREGRITLKASHESGQVQIEITDNGAGLDIDKIRQKAIQRGLISAEESAILSESDLHDSIFLPGFSTADQISNLSGRGVGMDVVKTNIERIGGTIEIDSRKDIGTTFRLTVPLTLAIIPALIVTCHGQRFAIPRSSVMEMLSLHGGQDRRIEHLHDTPVLRLRDEVLSIVSLSQQLRMSDASFDAGADVKVMVLKTGSRQFALIVDEIGNSEEIVVKPFGRILEGMSEYSGATIMGDGSLALILDVRGIAQRAGLFAVDRPLLQSATYSTESAETQVTEVESWLIADLCPRRRIAVPLAGVIHLEQVPAAKVEFSDGQFVIQYRGEIVPLLDASRFLAMSEADNESKMMDQAKTLSLVVYSVNGRMLGLVVQSVVDIIEWTAATLIQARPGPIRGTTVMLGRVTDVVDVARLVQAASVRFPMATQADPFQTTD
ncbi:MAG: chemotaxis protein CheW [Planctomycetes bacterium]|nr:chemotaxis protein CheW [Planctomycetota bacterium]